MGTDAITAIISLTIVAGLVVYVAILFKHSLKDSLNSDITYLRRIEQLRSSSTASKAFPVVFNYSSTGPHFSTSGMVSVGYFEMPYIAYCSEGSIHFEQVHYNGSIDDQYSEHCFSIPIDKLVISSELSGGILNRGSVEVYWMSTTANKPKASFFIEQCVLVNSEITEKTRIISRKIPKNLENQSLLIDELIKLGARFKDQ